MKTLRPARILYMSSAAALAYSGLLVLSFVMLFGPSWLTRGAGALLQALLWPLGVLGFHVTDGIGLLTVMVLAAGGILASGLLTFCSWLFLDDQAQPVEV